MLVAGKFEVVRELGRGAFGVVYEARDRYLDRAVAIKTIRDDLFGSVSSRESFEKRFLREARSVARLQHPNIIAVHEAGRDGEMSFIAMEFVRGKTLRDVLAARQRLPAAEVLQIADALLTALDYAHRQGIVHRDIKPENIMVREDGVLKVADFGIAKALHAESTTLTKDGAVMGTPSYMPPEQVLGKPVDGRADMFSAAALLYECLVGAKPFTAENLPALVHQILTAAPQPVPAQLQVPPHIVQALLRGMAKEPEQRFSSCLELLAALRGGPAPRAAAIADPQRTLAGPPTPTRASTFQGVLGQLPNPNARTLETTVASGGRSPLLAVAVAGLIFAGLVLLTAGAAAIYVLTQPGPTATRPGTPPPSVVPASPPQRTATPLASRAREPVAPPPRAPVTDEPPEIAPGRPSRSPENPAPPADDDEPAAADDDAVVRRAQAEIDAMASIVRAQIESGNWDHLAQHYTPDAVIVNGDGTFVGRSTIDTYYRTAAAVFQVTAPGQPIRWTYRWLSFESNGRTAKALTQNAFSVGGVLIDDSVFFNNYVKMDGRWYMSRVELGSASDVGDGGDVGALGGEGRDRKKSKKTSKGDDDDDADVDVEIRLPLPGRIPRPGKLRLPGR